MILLTGATGYVGGRLLRKLEERSMGVRCLVRDPDRLNGHVAPATEVVTGDVMDAPSLAAPMAGVDTAFYLVHSLGLAGDFEQAEQTAAENFAAAAKAAGVKKIVYLGGLGRPDGDLSPHLRSRHNVGRVLSASGVPVIEFRASVIIGSGSLSFEMIRSLAERLPVMVTPRWVRVPAQPIGIEDVKAYLLAALSTQPEGHTIYEIGGPEIMSYGGLMREYARCRSLRRLMIPVPVLTPRLSSLWLGLVTPLYARVGRKLIDSIRHPTVVRDDKAARKFAIRPMGVREAIERALNNEDREFALTRWSDAQSSSGIARQWGGVRFGNRLVDVRSVRIEAPPSRSFRPIRRIGGRTGWYFGNFLWRVRGWLDLLVGGVGMRRGRRDPENLRVGDALDCWRVEAFEPDSRLLLRAEMKLPGRAWLEFEVDAEGQGSRITQTALFDPDGLLGLAYWYVIRPMHELIFRGMLQGIAREAAR